MGLIHAVFLKKKKSNWVTLTKTNLSQNSESFSLLNLDLKEKIHVKLDSWDKSRNTF